jgi:hypothetical protein
LRRSETTDGVISL